MKINKRYKRDIKRNISLYVSSIVLTVLSLLLFYLYAISGAGITDFAKTFFESQKLEDASFSTYKEIPDDEIKKLEKKYDLVLEKQPYINLDTDGVTARIFKKTEKVDIYAVTGGRDVEKNNEIVISEGYAQNMGIKIGDDIKIKNKTYKLVGFIERPDYLYMLENINDSAKNVQSFFISYMTDDEFNSLGDKNLQYLVRYNSDNSKDFRKAINENYIMSSYTAKEDNYRISMVEEQPKLFIEMSYMVLFLMPLLVVMLISIILKRKIRNEQKMIGTLAAFGYTNSQIIRHYVFFAALPGVIGGILTTIVVYFCAQPYGAIGLMDYEPIKVEFKLNALEMLLGIVVPTLMYVLTTVLTVNKLLKNDIALLLQGAVKGKKKTRKYLVNKKVSFKTKFSVRSILGNFGRTAVLFLGVFLGSLVIFFGFGDMDTLSNIGTDTANNMEKYNYQYVLNEINKENKYGGETLLASNLEDEKGTILTLLGADSNSLIGLKDENGREIEADDRYLISSLYASISGAEVGDKIKVINPLSMEEYEIEVGGIAENNFQRAIYTSRKNVSKLSGIDEAYFNIILSKSELDIPEKSIVTKIDKAAVEEQYASVIDQMDSMIYSFAVIGVILCVVAVYVAVNMSVGENRTNISMLRVLGYDDRRINRLLLNDNIYIVLLAIALSIPVGIYAIKFLMLSFVDILGYLIEPHINISTYLITPAIVLLSYAVSLLLVRRKVKKVDMVESLKDNRE